MMYQLVTDWSSRDKGTKDHLGYRCRNVDSFHKRVHSIYDLNLNTKCHWLGHPGMCIIVLLSYQARTSICFESIFRISNMFSTTICGTILSLILNSLMFYVIPLKNGIGKQWSYYFWLVYFIKNVWWEKWEITDWKSDALSSLWT